MSASDSGAVSPVPEHLRTVTPRLVVSDGAAAIAFYARAFGAEQIGDRFTGPDGELIHAEIRIGDSVVMITEDAVDGPVSSPERAGQRPSFLASSLRNQARRAPRDRPMTGQQPCVSAAGRRRLAARRCPRVRACPGEAW